VAEKKIGHARIRRVLIILLLLSDISAPLPHGDWAQNCEARLRSAAHAYSSPEHPEWFDLWWKFRVRENAIDVRYTASVDICGVYDDFRVRVNRNGGKIQKLHDDGGDFAEFRRQFLPVIDACLREKDEQDGGEESRPVAEHATALRTSRATH
jgi:hypothetical protein